MILDEILNNPKTELLLEALEKNKKDSITIEKIIKEINERIRNCSFTFKEKNKKYIYVYMFLCNKLELTEELDELIEDPEFISLLDKTDIDGSMLPSLTSNCNKPRLTLITSQKLKNSLIKEDQLLSAVDILDDLTEEEIKALRNDTEIDNFLITNGLSFNTLKEETIKRLLEDTIAFSVYPFKTINDFANSYQNKEFLVNNDEFMNVYLRKLPAEYNYKNDIFKYLTQNKVDSLIELAENDNILLHLLKDTNNEIQDQMLKNKTIKKLLSTCDNPYILESLPSKFILNLILNKKDKTTEKDIKLINYLDKKETASLFNSSPNLYNEFIKNIENNSNFEFTNIINNLPTHLYKDLCEEKIKKFNLYTITDLIRVNKSFKKVILKNADIINKLYNSMDETNYNLLLYMFEVGKFTPEEKTKFILKINPINNNKVIVKLIEDIPNNYRKPFTDNQKIRSILLSAKGYKADEYLKKYLLNNIDKLKELNPEIIISILKESDKEFIKNILIDNNVTKKILTCENNNFICDFINIVKDNPELLNLINSKDLIEIYTPDLVELILPVLNVEKQKEFCTNDMVKHILKHDTETFNTYSKLLTRNRYLLNTLDFNFLNEKIPYFKLFMLEQITKDKELQNCLTKINQGFKLSPHLINSIFYDFDDISLNPTIVDILNILINSYNGKNRKHIGNIPKMISQLEEQELNKETYTDIINYLLFQIPRFNLDKKSIKRPIYNEVPNTYEDIKYYEIKTEEKLTNLIINSKKDTEIKEYFIAKHFKLSLLEAEHMLNKYSIYGIDKKIYKEEYEFIESLKNIINTESSNLKKLDSSYKIISMHQSFALENKIKNMYSKIYNYELKNKFCNMSYIENDLCQNLKIYNSPSDFLYLICNESIEKELETTDSYLTSWHNKVNKLNKGIHTSLISNDNFVFNNDYLFGFDGIKEDSIISISNRFINNDKIEEKFMTPRELIDNTRDINNTIIIDKFAIRPNHNNSNIPTIEPDYLLVDKDRLEEASYIEKIITISKEFKNKNNKNGLPIIAIDKEKTYNNELGKIRQLYNKYNRTKEIAIFSNILTKIENNYTAYRNTDKLIAKLFDIKEYLEIIEYFTANSKKAKDIKYIEDILIREQNKYNNLPRYLSCNFIIKKL